MAEDMRDYIIDTAGWAEVMVVVDVDGSKAVLIDSSSVIVLYTLAWNIGLKKATAVRIMLAPAPLKSMHLTLT